MINDINKSRCPAVSTSRLEAVDGLRGLAALVIVVYHLYMDGGAPELRLLRVNIFRPLHDGWCGVNLFLVLSGFCLYWPFARRPDRRLNVYDFMRKRVRRIVPAYYASLLLVPAAYVALSQVGVWFDQSHSRQMPTGPLDIVLHLFLLHSLWWKSIWSWNGVTWSLGLEWTWYLLFPIAVWSFRRWGASRSLVLALVLTVLYRVGLHVLFGPASHIPESELAWGFSLRAFVVGRLFEFCLGMYVAWAAANGRVPWGLARWSIPGMFLALGMAHAATPTDPFLPIRDGLYGIAFALLLTATVVIQGQTTRLLDRPWLVYVGECSYSLYLLHLPLVTAALALLRLAGLSGVGLFLASLIVIPISVFVARMAYLWVEAPFLRDSNGRVPHPQNDPLAAIAP